MREVAAVEVMGLGGVACPKPEPRKRAKARADRQETAVTREIRGLCVERDGHCRFFTYREDVSQAVGSCEGYGEWAHLGDKKRFKTRGQEPEIRHTTADSLMLCTRHHEDYDQHRIAIKPVTTDGANGQLRVTCGDREAIV